MTARSSAGEKAAGKEAEQEWGARQGVVAEEARVVLQMAESALLVAVEPAEREAETAERGARERRASASQPAGEAAPQAVAAGEEVPKAEEAQSAVAPPEEARF